MLSSVHAVNLWVLYVLVLIISHKEEREYTHKYIHAYIYELEGVRFLIP